MNFDFSDDLKLLREQARRFLSQRCTPQVVRGVLEGTRGPFDRDLWREIANMGWLGAITPERHGGVEMGQEALCVIAEELGRALAPVPFAASVYGATQALAAWGSDAQQARWLPALASGDAIGAVAFVTGLNNPSPAAVALRFAHGKLHGSLWPVAAGSIADLLVTPAHDEDGRLSLYLVPLEGVKREALRTVDPSSDQARLEFDGASAERLGAAGDGWRLAQALLDRAAVLTAFEQVGGAQASLEMARQYAVQRYAFGRPIGSFQAIKHKLADVYVAVELARSNAYYGAWALAADAPELPLAAATARVSATAAYHEASKENIQTHGGMGFTWESDCHLHYRRARQLALTLGSAPWWKDRLVDRWAAAGTRP